MIFDRHAALARSRAIRFPGKLLCMSRMYTSLQRMMLANDPGIVGLPSEAMFFGAFPPENSPRRDLPVAWRHPGRRSRCATVGKSDHEENPVSIAAYAGSLTRLLCATGKVSWYWSQAARGCRNARSWLSHLSRPKGPLKASGQ